MPTQQKSVRHSKSVGPVIASVERSSSDEPLAKRKRASTRKPKTEPGSTFNLSQWTERTNVDIASDSFQRKLEAVSTLIWDDALRNKRLDEQGFVELPKEVASYENTKKRLKAEKRILREQRELEKQKQSGLVSDSQRPTLKIETQEPKRSRKKPEALGVDFGHKSSNNLPRTNSANDLNSSVQQDNLYRPIKVEEEVRDTHSAIRRAVEPAIKSERPSQQPRVVKNSQPHDPAPIRIKKHPSRSHSRACEISKQVRHDEEQNPTRRSDSSMLDLRHIECTCEMLPEFFTRDWNNIPHERYWPGGRLEFLEHLKQISGCRGHPDRVIKHCQKILRAANYPERITGAAAIDFAERNSSPLARLPLRTHDHRSGSRFKGTEPLEPESTKPSESIAEEHCARGSHKEKFPRQRRMANPKPRHVADMTELEDYDPVTSRVGSSPEIMLSSAFPRIKRSSPSARRELGDAKVESTVPGNLKASGSSAASGTTPKVERPTSKRHHIVPLSQPINNEGHKAISRTGGPLQPLSTNTMSSDKTLRVVEKVVQDHMKQVEEMLKPIYDIFRDGFTNLTQDPAAASVSRENVEEPAPPPRKKRKSNAEKKAEKPVFSREVPRDQRLEDDALMEIGLEVSGYKRHQQAPYAFSWNGRLFAEYDYLMGNRDEHDNPVWDCKVLARLKH